MSEARNPVMKGAQCARIILCLSRMYGVSIEEATDIYYHTESASMIEEGVADLHCRSDKYLAEEIWKEYQETKHFA